MSIFISYTEAFSQYLMYLPEKHQIVKITHLTFIEFEANHQPVQNLVTEQELLQPEKVKQDFDEEFDKSSSKNEGAGKNVSQNIG